MILPGLASLVAEVGRVSWERDFTAEARRAQS
jgi:hypothetical protein